MLLLDSAVFDAAIDWLVNGLLGFSGWQIFFVILASPTLPLPASPSFCTVTRRTVPWIYTLLPRTSSAFGCG